MIENETSLWVSFNILDRGIHQWASWLLPNLVLETFAPKWAKGMLNELTPLPGTSEARVKWAKGDEKEDGFEPVLLISNPDGSRGIALKRGEGWACHEERQLLAQIGFLAPAGWLVMRHHILTPEKA